jgi:hypothetical protein
MRLAAPPARRRRVDLPSREALIDEVCEARAESLASSDRKTYFDTCTGRGANGG